METTPRFLNGVHAFTGTGLAAPAPVSPPLAYTVSSDKRSQMIYIRAGNSANEMIAVHLVRSGTPFRSFPIGAKGSIHVSLAVVEDLEPDSTLDVVVAAPEGVSGHVVLDIGFMEI
ncbi:MAG: hypothetical protein ACRYF2_15565 [Janthinobacterium lividum]